MEGHIAGLTGQIKIPAYTHNYYAHIMHQNNYFFVEVLNEIMI